MLYPQTPRPASPYPFRNIRPVVKGGPVWSPQSRALTVYGLLECDINYRGRSFDDVMVLWNFYESVGGSAGRFTFIDFNGIGMPGGSDPGAPWRGLFVAQTDGYAVSWDMPTYGARAYVTTIAAAITAGTRTVTPASMDGIKVGSILTVSNSNHTICQVVTVTAVTSTTFTAVFTYSLSGGSIVQCPLAFENGIAKETEIVSGSPDPFIGYHITAGGGTDGVDLLTYLIPSTVATAPSPALSGTALIVAAGTGVNFPTPSFYANVWPAGAAPSAANVETVQVTGITTDTFTIVRHQNGTSARSILVGDNIAVVPPTTGTIISTSAMCRRALRRATFLSDRNPFVYNVPANYEQQTVTIQEVRR